MTSNSEHEMKKYPGLWNPREPLYKWEVAYTGTGQWHARLPTKSLFTIFDDAVARFSKRLGLCHGFASLFRQRRRPGGPDCDVTFRAAPANMLDGSDIFFTRGASSGREP